ncbi:hypothetical protein GGR50DRAFT_445928 [Xylaria sp. CBS 124048]|nr:hypothetical protein GGR50DRAFT_445928 [Xylaria sp. CBS 124048]
MMIARLPIARLGRARLGRARLGRAHLMRARLGIQSPPRTLHTPLTTPSAEQSPDAEQPIEQDAMDVDQVAGENFGHDAMDVDQVAGENFGHDAMDVDQGAGENVGHNAMDVDLAHDDIAVADHLGPRTPDAMEQDSAETYHHNAEHVHSRLSTIPEGVEEDDEEQVQREKREEQNKQASPVETAQVAHPDLPSTPQGLRHPRARRGGPQAHTAPTARAPVLSLQDKIQRERDDPTPFNLPFSHLPPSMGSPETRAALEAFVDAQIEADWARNRYEYTEQDAIRDWMAMGNPDPRIENNYRDPRNREPRVESYHEANEQESRIESRNREPPVEGYHEANEQEPRAEHGQADKESDAEDTTGLYDPDNKHPGTFRLSSEPESDSGSSSDKDAAKLSLSVDYVTQNSNTASTASRERAGDDDDDAPRDVQRQQIGGGRNPRNPTLLSGAVVYVEVHASDGEDVSRHFVELLTEMGAHCVEAWPWTPTRSAEGVLNSADIGITHVIFKDGSKETVDKIVQANGFVHCVGVGWVLDCEKENRWLKEYTYQVEVVLSALLAEGYRIAERRRAAAAANNAMATPSQNSVSDPAPQAVPAGNIDRRQSTVWERSPSEPGDADAPGLEPGPGPEPGSGPAPAPAGAGWGPAALTPALNTPAPETIARFAMDISPGTPSTASPGSPPEANQQQLMQTAPPRPIEAMPIGQSLVERAPNETTQMRLLEARRKTLQHAPKVTSPLKKQWSATDSI